MRICLVGEGAFGKKHLAGLKNIDDVEVAVLVGGVADATQALATEQGIPHWTLDLQEGLSQPDVQAAILATPTPIHASQAIEVMRAGKHVEVEIPMAESLADAQRVVEVQRDTANEDFDRNFFDQLSRNPQSLADISHGEYLMQAGSEGIELVMWLIMRGAMNEDVKEIHRHYHVPASNTAAGLIILENAL